MIEVGPILTHESYGIVLPEGAIRRGWQDAGQQVAINSVSPKCVVGHPEEVV